MKLTANPASKALPVQQRRRCFEAQLLRIMKLTTIIILAACLQSAANGVAQNTVTISGKEVSVDYVFNAIKKQTSYRFFFNTDMLQHTSKVTIEVKNAPIDQVMHLALKDQPLTFAIKGRTIFIMKKEEENSILQAMPHTGEPVTVSGRVTDNKGQPLVGANVKVRGTNIGVTTDIQGRFTLNNVDPDAMLEISFVGHETQTLSVKGRTVFAIALGQKQSILDETVVIAYGTTSRRFTTGNIATIKAEDIEKAPVQNPLLALQGRVPGVEITQLTGLNGGGITVQIQGRNSIRSGLNPLIVIDGVPFPSQLTGASDLEGLALKGGSPLNYVNPADIESIDILKDADATAIYGSRAANGAILITTKKGKSGNAKISFNIQQGWGRVKQKIDLLNTRQYLDMRYEAFRNSGTDWTSSSVSADDLKVWDTSRYTDWQKVLIGGTAKYSVVGASVSGGSTNMQYLLGATYNRQTTVSPGNFDDKKGNIHLNLNGATANQRFKVQLSASYMFDQNHLPGRDLTELALKLSPDAPALYKEDGTLNWAINVAGKSTWNNPLANTVSKEFGNTTKNLISNINVSYQILKGLDLKSSFGYNNLQAELFNFLRLEGYRPEDRANADRYTTFANRNMSTWIIEPNLQYSGRIMRGKIEALLGTTIQQSNEKYLSVTGSGFSADALMKTLTAAKSTTVGVSSIGITRYNALFGRLNYIWKDKYLFNFTARRDGSNKFGDKNKFNDFGSIGLGWIFSEEKLVRNYLPFLDFGKIRISYGVTGNDQIPDFSYLSIYEINSPTILFQNAIGLNPKNIPNPYLQWERTRKWQTGIDIGVLSNKVMVGVVFARNRSSNQLISYVLPSMSGFSSITKNLPATIQNISWEFTLNTINLKTKNLTWSTSANLTIPKNKLVSFPGIELTSYASGSDGVVIGKPLGVKNVYHYVGVSPSNGKYLISDRNDNPTISSGAQNRKIIPLTIFYGGLSNTISYKNFQLDFLLQIVKTRGPRDYYWSNGSQYPGEFAGGSGNQPVTVLDRWQKPGDNSRVAPFYTSSFYTGGTTATDAFYTLDASYIRLKNLSFSWQLPNVLLKRTHLYNARVYCRGQNLAVVTNYSGLDPETGSGTLPPLQLWTIGINIDL